jgi:hypothetical protein
MDGSGTLSDGRRSNTSRIKHPAMPTVRPMDLEKESRFCGDGVLAAMDGATIMWKLLSPRV